MTPDAWNERHPPGTVVRYWPMARAGEPLVSTTSGPAFVMADARTTVVHVFHQGRNVPIALTHVEPVKVQHSLPPALTVRCQVCARAEGHWCVNELGTLRAFLHDERQQDADYPAQA